MNTNNNLTIVPESGAIMSTSEGFIDQDNHPNFIESNTKAVTIEELNRCIVPTARNLQNGIKTKNLDNHLIIKVFSRSG